VRVPADPRALGKFSYAKANKLNVAKYCKSQNEPTSYSDGGCKLVTDCELLSPTGIAQNSLPGQAPRSTARTFATRPAPFARLVSKALVILQAGLTAFAVGYVWTFRAVACSDTPRLFQKSTHACPRSPPFSGACKLAATGRGKLSVAVVESRQSTRKRHYLPPPCFCRLLTNHNVATLARRQIGRVRGALGKTPTSQHIGTCTHR
jgi:hypothetical protein